MQAVAPPPQKKNTTDIHPDLRGTMRGRKAREGAEGSARKLKECVWGGRGGVRQIDGAGRHSEDRKRYGVGSLGKDKQTN